MGLGEVDGRMDAEMNYEESGASAPDVGDKRVH
jgi:hypothetical protein